MAASVALDASQALLLNRSCRLSPAATPFTNSAGNVNGSHFNRQLGGCGSACTRLSARCQATEAQSSLQMPSLIMDRRTLLQLGIASSLSLLPVERSDAETQTAGELLELAPYSDLKDGFVFLVPSDWQKVDKSGATVLFEDPNKKSSTIGIVVLPVRISSLKEFGDIDSVADRLVEVEKKKQSTQEARILQLNERDVREGVPLYAIDYTVDSTRGVKRFLTAVTIAEKKLYILNIAFKDSPAEPAPNEFLASMQRVRDSFGLSPTRS